MKIDKRTSIAKFEKKDIPKLRYGVIHSQMGFHDGVSIVMDQIEYVMKKRRKIPQENIFYLVGKAKGRKKNVTENELIWHKDKTNTSMLKHFKTGYGGEISEEIEKRITQVKEAITDFIKTNKIDVIIAHNMSHPVNFITAVAISRYYRDSINKGKRTPKYILWWHDSHLERERFRDPSSDVRKYLLQGVPGNYVEYIMFINSMQLEMAQEYLHEIDEKKSKKKYYKSIINRQDVVFNTTKPMINSFEDLRKKEIAQRTSKFLDDFGIRELLRKKNLKLEDTLFCIQHTRLIPRKRVDFALEYCHELSSQLKKKKMKKGVVFFISGHQGDEPGDYRKDLVRLNRKLSKEHKTRKFFLVFAQDHIHEEPTEREFQFEEFPRIFASLGGIATYFSRVEGFGNNLLEVLSAGLIPVMYKYPVYKKDIEKFGFKVIGLDEFKIDPEAIDETVELIDKERRRHAWVEENLKILTKHFSHRIISAKLKRAIIRKRTHI